VRRNFTLILIVILSLGVLNHSRTYSFMGQGSDLKESNHDNGIQIENPSKSLSLDVSEQLWNHSFGGTGEDYIYAISNCSDSGYIMVGMTSSFGRYRDVWLTKTDQYGNWNWHRTFGGGGVQYGRDVIECSDGGYAIIGTTTTGNADILLIKTNSFGMQTWNKTFGYIHEDSGISILETSDGGFLLTCSYSPFVDTYLDLLIWTDSAGKQIRNVTYTSTMATALKTIACSSGGYLMVGSDNVIASPTIWAVKLDDSGEEDWSHYYGPGLAQDVIETTSGNYAITGSDLVDTVLVQITSSGGAIRTVTYNLGYDDHGSRISEHPLGGFVIAGSTSFTTLESQQALVLRVNSIGKVRWNTTVTGVNSTLGGLYISNDASILVASTIDQQEDSVQNGWLLSMPSFYFTQVCEDTNLERDIGYLFDSNTSMDMFLSTWWVNGSILEVDGNGVVRNSGILPMGEAGFYLSVNDTVGRVITELFYIMVYDTIAPRWVIGPENQIHEYGTIFSYDLEAIDASGLTYWINDTVNFEHTGDGNFESSSVLPLEVYPVRINVTDGFDNLLSTEFTITVVDTTIPSLNHPNDFIKEYTTTNAWLQWSCSDLLPDYFIISRNGTEIEFGFWNGTNLQVRLDGLDLGVYSFHLFINDTSGNEAEDEVIAYIADLIAPTINHPDDMWFIDGSKGHVIIWNPDDLFPTSYNIIVDGIEVESGEWDGSSISYTVDELSPGVHNCTILVMDINSNSIVDYVQVVVIDWPDETTTMPTTPTTTEPSSSSITSLETTTTSPTTPTTSETTQPTTNLFGYIRGVEGALTTGLILVGILAGLAIVVGLINIRMMRNMNS